MTSATPAGVSAVPPPPGPTGLRRVLWAWPLIGLGAVMLAGGLLGPAATVVTAVIGSSAMILYLISPLISTLGRSSRGTAVLAAAVVIPVLVAASVLFAAQRGVRALERAKAPRSAGAFDEFQTQRRVDSLDDLAGELENRHLEGVVFGVPDLSGRSFYGAHLAGAQFDGVDLARANLRRADLRGALLTGSLRGADLRDSDLRGAMLDGADLAGACLDGADLRGASIRRVRAQGAHLAGVHSDDEAAWKAIGASTGTAATSCPD